MDLWEPGERYRPLGPLVSISDSPKFKKNDTQLVYKNMKVTVLVKEIRVDYLPYTL